MERIDRRGDAGKKTLLTLHPAETDITCEANSELAPYKNVSVQLEWAGLTGTLDGTFVLQQSDFDSPASTQWDNMGLAKTLDTADGSVTLADVSFSGRRIRAVYTANGITGGDLNSEIIAKK